jgi:GMP synthase (glutamine-hydrolysing)
MAQNTAKSASETPAAHHERVLIVDFGSQVTQLIARRVRENGVYCEIHPYNKVDAGLLKRFAPKAIILSGGPCSVLDDPSPRAPEEAFKLGVTILAIC